MNGIMNGNGIDAAAACHLETALYAAADKDTPRALGALLAIDSASWEGIRARLHDPLTLALLGPQIADLIDQMPAAMRALLLGPAEPPTSIPAAPQTALNASAPAEPRDADALDPSQAEPAAAEPTKEPESAAAEPVPMPQVSDEALAACFGAAASTSGGQGRQQSAVSAA
jgi:hypothetical protein